MNELLTNSRTETFFFCMKKHWYEYELGLRSVTDKEALVFGDAFHYGLETMDAAKGVRRYDESKADVIDEDKRYQHELNRIALFNMLNAYFWRWDEQGKASTVLAKELMFQVPLINPDTNRPSQKFCSAGKIDGIVKLPDGRIAVMEHKTTSFSLDIDSPYWKKLYMDKQISLYFVAAKKLGYEVETIIYDVAKKPSTSLKKLTQGNTKEMIETGQYLGKSFDIKVSTFEEDGFQSAHVWIDDVPATVEPGKKGFAVKETPGMYGVRIWQELTENYDTYFCRKEIPRLNGDIEDFMKDQWNTSQILNHCKNNDFWPKNCSACFSHFGQCPYYDLCVSNFNGNSVPDGFVKLDNVHPELDGDNNNDTDNETTDSDTADQYAESVN